MCGFAGEFLLADGRADPAVCAAMARKLQHRGPDDSGDYLSPDGRCAISFRRLAVIDPAGSRQPMTSADQAATIAFNGEIYNFRQLRQELERAGARFRTAGDTEVLLGVYRQYGIEGAGRLQGMFAFAVYDPPAGRLLLARDRVGIKPLWYAALPDRIVFASEAPALLEHPGVGREVDRESLLYYMTMGYVPGPRSAWSGIRKLPPGCTLLADGEVHDPKPFWQPPEPGVSSPADAAQIRQVLADAVAARMVSDVPLGTLLSGGVDSAAIVAAMCQAAGRTGGVRTFTAVFEDAEYDERQAAAAVARHCGTEHTEIPVRPEATGAAQRVVDHYGEPFADASALPTMLLCAGAREHVTVALAGDGGDEAFGGYDRYRALELAAHMKPAKYFALLLAGAIAGPFLSRRERSRGRRLRRFVHSLPYPPSVQYFQYRRLFGPDDLRRLLTEDFLDGLEAEAPAEWFCELYERSDVPDEVTRAQLHDLRTYLPDDLLVKTDIASMASSLEIRLPMLDPAVLEVGLALETKAKIGRRLGKMALREALRDSLPPGHASLPKKGFAVPLARWLREEMREDLTSTLLSGSLLDRGIFQPAAVHGLVNDHLRGRDDHAHRLWALLVLAKWLERWG